jgi:hypothetical protein
MNLKLPWKPEKTYWTTSSLKLLCFIESIRKNIFLSIPHCLFLYSFPIFIYLLHTVLVWLSRVSCANVGLSMQSRLRQNVLYFSCVSENASRLSCVTALSVFVSLRHLATQKLGDSHIISSLGLFCSFVYILSQPLSSTFGVHNKIITLE